MTALDREYDYMRRAGLKPIRPRHAGQGREAPRRFHPNCYGAFVFDPDGHSIEAVCHQPEG